MHDDFRRPVVEVAILLLLSLSTIRASSELGSRLASPAPSPGSPGCYQDDRCTLLEFKKGLLNEGEPALASWRMTDVRLWKGVTWKATVDGKLGVEKLELGQFELNGTSIRPLLQDQGLDSLTTLNVSGNFFTAALPDPLRICPALLVLDLSNNSFFGNLPGNFSCDNQVNSSTTLNLATLTVINLHVLNLSQNNFSGEVPNSLFSSLSPGENGGNLSNLTSLVLEDNFFEGDIPSSLESCTELVELKLSSNRFRSFPFDALQHLEKLETLEAMHNFISGNLQISNDGGSFGQLKSLALGYNFLSGHIPESLGNLSNLKTLELKFNNLTGIIPDTLAKLANLEILGLNQDSLNGSIPEAFSGLASLTTLSLNRNKLTGSIPPYLSNFTNLRSIGLAQNSFSGPIPPELANLTSIVVLSLYGNYLNDSMPEELGRLRTLMFLDVSRNNLVGNIPDGLCDLFRLQVLFLNNNQLTGWIPACFGNFTYIRLLDLSNNYLSGEFPDDLGNLSSNLQLLSEAPNELSSATFIEELSSSGGQSLVFRFSESPISYFFNNNLLSGPIPTSFGNIQNLQQLSLHNNLLSGPIPEALGNASSLSYLHLSYNSLSGPIPFSLTNLHFLSSSNFSFNNLSGSIPQASQFSTFTRASFLGNPYLCGNPLSGKCPPPALCPLLVSCSSMQPNPNLSSYSNRHESFLQKWVSIPAFGIGIAISFSLLSTFLIPLACNSGKRAKVVKIVPRRRKPYGLFNDPK